MRILNSLVGGLVEVLLFPFRQMPPLVGLAIVSVLTGVGMLLVFRATSNQPAIKAIRRRISASVFEMRLFNDDPRTILAAQADVFRHTLRYVGLTFVPVLWMIVPLVLVLIQLQFHYGYRGLEVGRAAIVKVTLRDPSASAASALALDPGSGVTVETPRLWIPAQREATWRIVAESPGEHVVTVRVGEDRFEKTINVSEAIVPRAPVRPSGLWGQVVHPVETPLPGNAVVESIAVTYPERMVSLFGWETHWLVVFFLLSIVAAFALQRPFKVAL